LILDEAFIGLVFGIIRITAIANTNFSGSSNGKVNLSWASSILV
jgi:hypothetical protein